MKDNSYNSESRQEFSKNSFYEALPLFMTEDEINQKPLPKILFHNFRWQDKSYELLIHPVQLAGEGSGKFYFPGRAEEKAWAALQRLMVKDNKFFDVERNTLYFTVNQLVSILSEELSTDEIEFAINILAHTGYEVVSNDSSFSFFPISFFRRKEINSEICYQATFSEEVINSVMLTNFISKSEL